MVANCAEHVQRWHHGVRPGTPSPNGLDCGLWSEKPSLKASAEKAIGRHGRKI